MKRRNYATIVYKDSCNTDYMNILESSYIQVAISPIHDKDIYESGEHKGELKKPHRHILISYDSPREEKQAKELFEKIGGVGIEYVDSKKGYYDYLTHKNNENKAKYDENSIILLNGFNISENELKMNYKEIEAYKKEIIKIVKTIDIHEYAKLIDYLYDNELNEMLEVASNKTIFFTGYINSRRYSIAKEEKV